MSRTQPPHCPRCGAVSVAAILYGMPAFDERLAADLEAGRVALGGCCVSDDMPEWQCGRCSYKWIADEMALTPGRKAARTRRRRAAGRKAAATRKRRAAARKAALTRKRRTAAKKAAATRKRRATGR